MPLSVYSTTFADYSAGMHLVQGVLLALLQRQKTGRGQLVSVSLLNSMLAAQTQEAAAHMMRGREVNWGAMPLSGVFETTRRRAGDGRRVQGRSRCRTSAPRSASPALRGRSALRDPRAAGGEQAGAAGDLPRALQDQHDGALDRPARGAGPALRAGAHASPRRSPTSRRAINGMILRGAESRVETVRVVGSPIHMSDAPVTIRIPPAELGQHTDEVLAELARRARPNGRVMPILFEVEGPRRPRHHRPAGGAERHRRGGRARAAGDLGDDRAQPRRPRGGADRQPASAPSRPAPT